MTDSVHSQRPMIVYSVPDQYISTSGTETEVHLPEVHREIKLLVIWTLGWQGLNLKSVISNP